jgi:DNA sulfur modification protein DndC
MDQKEQEAAGQGVFDLPTTYKEIQAIYCQDSRPWILGYSGGKDSTAILQLVFIAVSQLPKSKRTKTIHVLTSDTLVETPPIVRFIRDTMSAVARAAKELDLPIETHIVSPETEDTFWVNLIGRGYPSPNRWFRWCTDRMKIQPANRFILKQVSQYGEAVVVLGVRKSESATRAQVMSFHEIPGQVLRRHSTLPNAYVYAPIENWELRDVWTFLLSIPSPWGQDNRSLVALYKKARGTGECPLVIDTTTPSCGNSRFGCWVCTVVERDRSMEAFIDAGEDWMEPLLELREWLAQIRNDPTKRAQKRRNGQAGLGPFTMETRQEVLRRLLKTQQAVGQELISSEELQEIQRVWHDDGDWEDSVLKIIEEAGMQHLKVRVARSERKLYGTLEYKHLRSLCEKHDVPVELVQRLISLEKDVVHLARRHALPERFEAVFNEAWKLEGELAFEPMEGQPDAP